MLEAGRPESWEANIDLILMFPGSPASKLFAFNYTLSGGSDMSRGSISLAALLWLVIAFLVIYPLSILVVESFKIAETGGWGIGNYLEFFQDAYYLKTFGNTLLSKLRWYS